MNTMRYVTSTVGVTVGRDLTAFVELPFYILQPGEMLAAASSRFIKRLLHSCEEDPQRRFILNMPPGYMKWAVGLLCRALH